MKVLAFGASSSKKSINKEFAEYTARLISQDVNLIDLNDYEVPIYSQDKEDKDGVPKKIQKLFKMIGDSDLIVISFAEHNGSYTAAYKNVFDWLSRIDQGVFQGKKVIYLSTSIGEFGASSVLQQAVSSLKFFNGDLIMAYSLPSFYENFKDGVLVDYFKSDYEKKLTEIIRKNF